MAVVEQPQQQVVKLFNCWSFEDVQVNDISLADYLAVSSTKHATYLPHTAGRYSAKRFRKAQCPLVERLTNSLMMHGRNNGKKIMAVRIVKHAMEIIHLLTDANPIQVIVDAIINRYHRPIPNSFQLRTSIVQFTFFSITLTLLYANAYHCPITPTLTLICKCS
jgi:ribosomal protein uS7